MSKTILKHGDCLEIIKQIKDRSLGGVITDPPYGMNFQSHRRAKEYDKITNDNNLNWLNEYFKETYRCLKDDTAIYCFCSWHNVDVFKQAFQQYYKLKNILIWVKNNHGSGDLQASYAPRYEMILYGNKGRCLFKNGRNDDVLFFNKTNNEYHPTQKPVELIEHLLSNSTKENDWIFDGYMGSGSTGVACKHLNRNFIGIEIDKEYFDIATNRINNE